MSTTCLKSMKSTLDDAFEDDEFMDAIPIVNFDAVRFLDLVKTNTKCPDELSYRKSTQKIHCLKIFWKTDN
jgi:hypothetical protein